MSGEQVKIKVPCLTCGGRGYWTTSEGWVLMCRRCTGSGLTSTFGCPRPKTFRKGNSNLKREKSEW